MKKKTGRPVKAIKKNQQLAVMCSELERRIIRQKAEKANCTISQFLRELGVSAKVEIKAKFIPPEVLALSGTLNQVAANLNQIARKRNMDEELSAIQRAELNYLFSELKGIAQTIRNHLT
jgi:hypothetical protein